MTRVYNNEALYSDCQRAFMETIRETIGIVVSRSNLEANEANELISNLTFALATHLDGSSFGGRVGDQEIYPAVGFCVGEQDDSLLLGNGAGFMHALQQRQ